MPNYAYSYKYSSIQTRIKEQRYTNANHAIKPHNKELNKKVYQCFGSVFISCGNESSLTWVLPALRGCCQPYVGAVNREIVSHKYTGTYSTMSSNETKKSQLNTPNLIDKKVPVKYRIF